MRDLLVLALVLFCVYLVIQIGKDFFGRPVSNRYATPGDRSIRVDWRMERRRRKLREGVLLLMILLATIGAIIYFLGQ
jgi:hypothetical protein